MRCHGLIVFKYLALLTGCDYYTVKDIGPKKALDILTPHLLAFQALDRHPLVHRSLICIVLSLSSSAKPSPLRESSSSTLK